MGCLLVPMHQRWGRLIASSAPSWNFPLCLPLVQIAFIKKANLMSLSICFLTSETLTGRYDDLRIWTRKHLKTHGSHLWCSSPLFWSLRCLCSLWWSLNHLSGLCLLSVVSICSYLAFLSSHNIPTITDTTLFEFHSFTKHFDLKSQSQIYHPSLKSLMKRFWFVCSL